MPRKTGSKMTVSEAGRMGGETVAQRYGHEHFEEIGRKGGSIGGPKVRDLIQRGKRRS
jgi:general stress protein YciG